MYEDAGPSAVKFSEDGALVANHASSLDGNEESCAPEIIENLTESDAIINSLRAQLAETEKKLSTAAEFGRVLLDSKDALEREKEALERELEAEHHETWRARQETQTLWARVEDLGSKVFKLECLNLELSAEHRNELDRGHAHVEKTSNEDILALKSMYERLKEANTELQNELAEEQLAHEATRKLTKQAQQIFSTVSTAPNSPLNKLTPASRNMSMSPMGSGTLKERKKPFFEFDEEAITPYNKKKKSFDYSTSDSSGEHGVFEISENLTVDALKQWTALQEQQIHDQYRVINALRAQVRVYRRQQGDTWPRSRRSHSSEERFASISPEQNRTATVARAFPDIESPPDISPDTSPLKEVPEVPIEYENDSDEDNSGKRLDIFQCSKLNPPAFPMPARHKRTRTLDSFYKLENISGSTPLSCKRSNSDPSILSTLEKRGIPKAENMAEQIEQCTIELENIVKGVECAAEGSFLDGQSELSETLDISGLDHDGFGNRSLAAELDAVRGTQGCGGPSLLQTSAEVPALCQRCKHRISEHTDVQSKVDELSRDLKLSEERGKLMDAELKNNKEMINQLSAAESALLSLQSELEQNQAEKELLEASNQALQLENGKLKLSESALQALLNRKEDAVQQQLQRIIRVSIDDSIETAKMHQEMYAVLLEKNVRLEAELNDSQTEACKWNSTEEELLIIKGDYLALERKNKELIDANTHLIAEKEAQAIQNEKDSVSRKALNDEMCKQMAEKNAHLAAEIEALAAHYENEAALSKLKNDEMLQKFGKDCLQLKKENNRLTTLVKALTDEVSASSEDKSKNVGELDALNLKFQVYEEEQHKILQENEKLVANNNALESKLCTVTSELKIAVDEARNLRLKVKTFDEEQHQLLQEKEKLVATNSLLKAELVTVTNDLKSAVDETKDLKAKLKELEEQHLEFDQQKVMFFANNSSLETKLLTASNDLKTAFDEIRDLKEKLQENQPCLEQELQMAKTKINNLENEKAMLMLRAEYLTSPQQQIYENDLKTNLQMKLDSALEDRNESMAVAVAQQHTIQNLKNKLKTSTLLSAALEKERIGFMSQVEDMAAKIRFLEKELVHLGTQDKIVQEYKDELKRVQQELSDMTLSKERAERKINELISNNHVLEHEVDNLERTERELRYSVDSPELKTEAVHFNTEASGNSTLHMAAEKRCLLDSSEHKIDEIRPKNTADKNSMPVIVETFQGSVPSSPVETSSSSRPAERHIIIDESPNISPLQTECSESEKLLKDKESIINALSRNLSKLMKDAVALQDKLDVAQENLSAVTLQLVDCERRMTSKNDEMKCLDEQKDVLQKEIIELTTKNESLHLQNKKEIEDNFKKQNEFEACIARLQQEKDKTVRDLKTQVQNLTIQIEKCALKPAVKAAATNTDEPQNVPSRAQFDSWWGILQSSILLVFVVTPVWIALQFQWQESKCSPLLQDTKCSNISRICLEPEFPGTVAEALKAVGIEALTKANKIDSSAYIEAAEKYLRLSHNTIAIDGKLAGDLGSQLFRQNFTALAREWWEIGTEQGHNEYHSNIGVWKISENDSYVDAIRYFENAINCNLPKTEEIYADVLSNLAVALVHPKTSDLVRNTSRGVLLFQQAVEIYQNLQTPIVTELEVVVTQNLAIGLYLNNQSDDAIVYLRRAQNRMQAHMELGWCTTLYNTGIELKRVFSASVVDSSTSLVVANSLKLILI